jgi:undecaprenyl-diphosphatase
MQRVLVPATGFLVFLVLFSSSAAPESLDQHLFTQIHERWQSNALDPVMETATDLGDVRVALGLNVILATYGEEGEREASKLALTALVASEAVAGLLKYAVNRERPDENAPHDRWNSSFPSGHATGAFALATVFGSRYPRYRMPIFATASLIGISRIYLGRHYPSDVLGGAAVGVAIGCVTLRNDEFIIGLHF